MAERHARAAFHDMGIEYDDAAAYPRARAAMVPCGRNMTLAFLKDRKEILLAFGAKMFKEEPVEERRSRMKFITNAWDMDAGEDIWIKQYGNPHHRTLRGMTVKLGDGSCFSMDAYRSEISGATKWIAEHSARAVAFVREYRPKNNRGKKRRPEIQLKSYLLQEAEATARDAKVAWFESQGMRVTSLQHDGVLVASNGNDQQSLEKGSSNAATQACGFQVEVVGPKREAVVVD